MQGPDASEPHAEGGIGWAPAVAATSVPVWLGTRSMARIPGDRDRSSLGVTARRHHVGSGVARFDCLFVRSLVFLAAHFHIDLEALVILLRDRVRAEAGANLRGRLSPGTCL